MLKSLALKVEVTRGQTSDNNDSQDQSDEDENKDEEFNLMARKFRKSFERVIGKNKAFVGEACSDNEDADELKNDTTCLMETESQKAMTTRDNSPRKSNGRSSCLPELEEDVDG
ncbi:hypothetical protein Tco_1060757 [Tanacetum coccineum]